MGAGIVSFGAYIPKYRLDRKLIGEAWGTRPIGGERAVASHDEDSLTMAVAAGVDCLGNIDRSQIDGVYFASTTSPYKEKQAAATIAAALDLRKDIRGVDFADSLRSGTQALAAALDSVNAGSARLILVAVADCRLGSPTTAFEQNFGDGAAAFLVGDKDVAVAVEGCHCVTDDFLELWRRDGDSLVKFWEERFRTVEGYNRVMPEVIKGIYQKCNIKPKELSKVAMYAAEARNMGDLVKVLGVDPKTQIQEPLFNLVGNTGAAFAPMSLVAALEDAKPGDKILLLGYGDGGDAFLLKVTEQIENTRGKRAIKKHLTSKMMLLSYAKYLRFRGLVQTDIGPFYKTGSSVSQLWRDSASVIRFHGAKCKKCGRVRYPIDRVCTYCQAKDENEEVRLSDKKATLFSFTADEGWALVPDAPLFEGHINFEGGGRAHIEFTDMGMSPKDVKVGMPMEVTFRRMHEGADFHNYFWKATPVR